MHSWALLYPVILLFVGGNGSINLDLRFHGKWAVEEGCPIDLSNMPLRKANFSKAVNSDIISITGDMQYCKS